MTKLTDKEILDFVRENLRLGKNIFGDVYLCKVSCNIIGDVEGNVVGNVDGNVYGNVGGGVFGTVKEKKVTND